MTSMTDTDTGLLRALLDHMRGMVLERAIKNRWSSFSIVLEVSNKYGRVTAVSFVRANKRTTIEVEGSTPIVWNGGRAPELAVVALGKKFLEPTVPTVPEVVA